MPPRGVKSAKKKREYEHIKQSYKKRGNKRAEEIAARTVNKERGKSGQTKKKSSAKAKSKSSSKGS